MVRKLPNLGLPFMNNPHQFGHVYIRYIVEFPKSIDQSWISNLESQISQRIEVGFKTIDCEIKVEEIYKDREFKTIS